MYEDMINMSGNASARFFVVATQIQKEKKAMMQEVGFIGPISIHSYEELHDAWMEYVVNAKVSA